jgi:hypothetical protein
MTLRPLIGSYLPSTSFGMPEVKMWVKVRAASPARPASPREKGAITILRSELFMEKSFSSLSFF